MQFLFELYTEEIPASYQKNAVGQWQTALSGLLKENLLNWQGLSVYATSRRLLVLIDSLAEKQNEETEILKGPPENLCFDAGQKPTAALEGFAARAGVSIDQVVFQQFGKARYATASAQKGGRPAVEVLASVIEKVLTETRFPRSMRWGNKDILYPRPVLGYFALHGQKQVFFTGGIWQEIAALPGVEGHFVFSPGFSKVSSVAEYFALLQKQGIEPDPAQRREKIQTMLEQTAAGMGLKPVIPADLLDEVNFLVERPAVIAARFPDSFLDLPDPVILSEMQEHQRYFGLRDHSGRLSSQFLIVSNGDAENGLAAANIRAGNERVINARLSDGAFFYHEDRKTPLLAKVQGLHKIVFQEGMGSMFEKKERLKQIAATLGRHFAPELEPADLSLACDYLKADLSTQLVYEFDSLQGEIGTIYARLDGEKEEICRSILEHYLPRNQNDDYPESRMGVLLSVAEKLDNIVAGFILGKGPTSSQDPLALRRQALYAIEIFIRQNIHLTLPSLLLEMLEHYPPETIKEPKEKIAAEIWDFFRGRLATIFDKQGFDKKMIRAGIYSHSQDIYDLYLKLEALRKLQGNEDFAAMMAAFKRMSNIVADQKDADIALVKEQLFQQNEEKELFALSAQLAEKLTGSNERGQQYEEIFLLLAQSKGIVDAFFDGVMVNHEDEHIRKNRLALLRMTLSPLQNLLNLNELK